MVLKRTIPILSLKKEIKMTIYFLHVDRMYLHEILRLINKNDTRAVKTWCRKSNVNVYKDSSGEFVTKADFELAYDWPLILTLKAIHGDRWRIIYEAYLKDNLADAMDFSAPTQKSTNYVAKGNLSKKLFGKS
jgi:hypothetical protein